MSVELLFFLLLGFPNMMSTFSRTIHPSELFRTTCSKNRRERYERISIPCSASCEGICLNKYNGHETTSNLLRFPKQMNALNTPKR
uniref:Putative secreted protein n=1 Tax=Anopheles marajoara TaxID=58244 RepID=A0A2M4CAK0_9DIPT